MSKTQILLNIDEELKEKLKGIAKEENRTLSNLIETALIELVQNWEKTSYLKLGNIKDDLWEVINKNTQEERLTALWDMAHKYLDN